MGKKPHKRKLPIRSISNLRDLGGYQTTDGQRQVRWRVLFRSGHLNNLHGTDIHRFNDLNIGTVIDFRSDFEKEQEPDMLPEDRSIYQISLPILDEGNSEMMSDLRRRFEENDLDDLDTVAIMVHTYQQFAARFYKEYASFFQLLLHANGQPVLWHCTAGKDRAGFAAALVLKLLDVPEETIIADYMLSAKYARPPRKTIAMLRAFRGRKAVELVKPMYGVKTEWILTTFRTIEERWGSFENYTQEALGLTDEDITRLRELYTEELN